MSATPTQNEKIANEKEIAKNFPLLKDALSFKGDSIIGFTPEQFEALKNHEQARLDKLTEAFGIAIKDSLGRTPAPTPSSKVETAAPVKNVPRVVGLPVTCAIVMLSSDGAEPSVIAPKLALVPLYHATVPLPCPVAFTRKYCLAGTASCPPGIKIASLS